jgi:hypothetical protein
MPGLEEEQEVGVYVGFGQIDGVILCKWEYKGLAIFDRSRFLIAT